MASGQAELALTPIELRDRLAALMMPWPRRHLHHYVGVFVPHAAPRARDPPELYAGFACAFDQSPLWDPTAAASEPSIHFDQTLNCPGPDHPALGAASQLRRGSAALAPRFLQRRSCCREQRSAAVANRPQSPRTTVPHHPIAWITAHRTGRSPSSRSKGAAARQAVYIFFREARDTKMQRLGATVNLFMPETGSDAMKLLTPETLTRDQFVLLRDAPLFVVVAISGSGGSRLDSLFERAAGAKAILNGKNNDHPLIRAISVPAEVDVAMSVVDSAVREARGALAPPATLRQLAVDSLRQAVSVLRLQGGDLDLFAYREFIRSVAKRVAEAAREQDILGIGGQFVSDGEREVLMAIEKELA